MSSKKRREQKKREKEMNFFSVKASFVTGIVLVITIIKDIAELFITIPPFVVGCYLTFCLLVSFFILGTPVFDAKLNSKGISNFGSFLTVGSIIVFIIENSVIRYQDAALKINAFIVVASIGVTIIAGSLYLLFHKD